MLKPYQSETVRRWVCLSKYLLNKAEVNVEGTLDNYIEYLKATLQLWNNLGAKCFHDSWINF